MYDDGLNVRSSDGVGMRKVIAFDEATYQALVQLGRDRMATLQELADESFADLLKKHGVPKDLREALRRSASASAPAAKRKKKSARRK